MTEERKGDLTGPQFPQATEELADGNSEIHAPPITLKKQESERSVRLKKRPYGVESPLFCNIYLDNSKPVDMGKGKPKGRSGGVTILGLTKEEAKNVHNALNKALREEPDCMILS